MHLIESDRVVGSVRLRAIEKKREEKLRNFPLLLHAERRPLLLLAVLLPPTTPRPAASPRREPTLCPVTSPRCQPRHLFLRPSRTAPLFPVSDLLPGGFWVSLKELSPHTQDDAESFVYEKCNSTPITPVLENGGQI
uniref:Uncharacterized protein n=1 Tax=Cucumis melo TaxID=3656 RepID=A0A9I9ECT8_CUCME